MSLADRQPGADREAPVGTWASLQAAAEQPGALSQARQPSSPAPHWPRTVAGRSPPPGRVSARLLARLSRPGRTLAGPAGRLALADALLAAMTAGMLASGFWDWSAGHPTRIRWHAISGSKVG